MVVKYWRNCATFIVEIANPPVNAINLAVRCGLLDAIKVVNSQPDQSIERVVISGGAKIFAAGGDAREFDGPPLEPHLPDILALIEASPVPWVAAMNGVVLGGGLEISLACRYRIASSKTQLGLPEVLLGVVPGAGGTQRLPRLIGIETALTMITSGKPAAAKAALASGLIDQIDDDPLAAACTIPLATIMENTPLNCLGRPRMDEAALSQLAKTEARIAGRAKGQIAPIEAVKLVKLACDADFTTGMARERETFLQLRSSPQAKALRHVFFAERGANIPASVADIKPGKIDNAVVIGGGIMGAGIAHALIAAGIATITLETDQGAVDRAYSTANKLIDDGMKRGLITPKRAQEMRGLHQISVNYMDASNAQIAIEAAFEDMSVKQDIFKKLQDVMPQDAVLATNTSYLDIDEIATVLDNPARLIGLHFFMPAHIMKLLEIVRGAQSSSAALAAGFGLAKQLRKTPVLASVCDGFIGNRILARTREVADGLLLDGALPWEIDAAMLKFGYAMGPYQTQDMSGLDIAFANRRRQDKTRDPSRRYVTIADEMVAAGRLGRKAGAGWYSYGEGAATPQQNPDTIALILAASARANIQRRSFNDDEISNKLILAMINEASMILDEGIANSATDIDLVSLLGYGFPRFRGGLMFHADTIGAASILAQLQALMKEDALAWQPSKMILNCAKTGSNFANSS